MMRRAGMFGTVCSALLVTAALALAVQATAATTPEWFECIKQKGGAYQKFCGAEGGKGGYIVKAGVGSPTFKARGGKVTFGGPRDAITCGTTIEGVKQMPNLVSSVTLVMNACHRQNEMKQHCELQEEREAPKEAKFESETLEGELGYISRSPLKVGLKLTPAAGAEGVVFTRIYCIGPAQHFRLRGSFVAEIGNAVNVMSKKMTLNWVPGPYLGPGEPEVDPTLEGEAAGGFIEEIHTTGEEFGEPKASSVLGTATAVGSQMIKA